MKIVALTDKTCERKFIVLSEMENVYCLIKMIDELYKDYLLDCGYIFPMKYASVFLIKLLKGYWTDPLFFVEALSKVSDTYDELIVFLRSEYIRSETERTKAIYFRFYKILPSSKIKRIRRSLTLFKKSSMYDIEIFELLDVGEVEVRVYEENFCYIKEFKSIKELKRFNNLHELSKYVKEKVVVKKNMKQRRSDSMSERKIVAFTFTVEWEEKRLIALTEAENVYCLIKMIDELYKDYSLEWGYIFPVKYAYVFFNRILKEEEWNAILFVERFSKVSDTYDELITFYCIEDDKKIIYYFSLYKILPSSKIKKIHSSIELTDKSFEYQIKIVKFFDGHVKVYLYPKEIDGYYLKKFKSLKELKKFNNIHELSEYAKEKGKYIR